MRKVRRRWRKGGAEQEYERRVPLLHGRRLGSVQPQYPSNNIIMKPRSEGWSSDWWLHPFNLCTHSLVCSFLWRNVHYSVGCLGLYCHGCSFGSVVQGLIEGNWAGFEKSCWARPTKRAHLWEFHIPLVTWQPTIGFLDVEALTGQWKTRSLGCDITQTKTKISCFRSKVKTLNSDLRAGNCPLRSSSSLR